MRKKSYTCLVEIQNGINNKVFEIYFQWTGAYEAIT